MKHYEIEDQDRIGKEIAKMLCLKKDRYRYQTTWGNKTAIGIFNTIIKLARDIEDGKEINA